MGKRKILVTGATGLVGGNLTRLLVASRGEQVKVLLRSGSNARAIDGLDVERVEGDVTDPASLRRAMVDCDRVFHVAALVSNWNGYLDAMRAVNVGGTANVLQAAFDLGVERVVHVSTNGALGLGARDRPADETAPYDYDGYRNAYSLTKYEAHQVALDFARRGLDVVIGCPTYMFGAWDVKPTSGTMILEVKAGRTFACPTGGNNIVDVLDVCHGLVAASERGRTGEAYLLCNARGNLTYREIFTLIAETVGGRAPAFELPTWLARAGGSVIDVYAKAAGLAPEINAASAYLGGKFQHYTPAKAIRELDLPQSDVAAAIRRAHDWFREHGYLERPPSGIARPADRATGKVR